VEFVQGSVRLSPSWGAAARVRAARWLFYPFLLRRDAGSDPAGRNLKLHQCSCQCRWTLSCIPCATSPCLTLQLRGLTDPPLAHTPPCPTHCRHIPFGLA
jgi:hypothetical protein